MPRAFTSACRRLQGHSLFDPQHPKRVYFFLWCADEILVGVREGDWKYYCNSFTGFEELYKLKSDPGEMSNVAADNEKICHDLALQLGPGSRISTGMEPKLTVIRRRRRERHGKKQLE